MKKVPTLRFKDFTDDWKEESFSDLTYPSGTKNKENLPLESYSITNESGFVPQNEQFENGGTMKDADKRLYRIVSPNSFAYNPARINVGSIGYQNLGKDVIVSSLYEIFKTKGNCEDSFFWNWFKSDDFQKLILNLQEGGVRLYFYYDKLKQGKISIPSKKEQTKIGLFLSKLDNLISEQEKKCKKLSAIKKSLLSLMFPSTESLVPALRYANFKMDWIKYSFNDFFQTNISNNTISRDGLTLEEKKVRNIHYGDILTKYGAYIDCYKEVITYIEDENFAIGSNNLLRNGDIIVADTAEDETAGKVSEITNCSEFIVSGLHTMVCRPKEEQEKCFIGYYMNSDSYHKQVVSYLQGTKVLSLSKSNIEKTFLLVPEKEEQKRIVTLLIKLDQLIVLENKKYEKLLQIKKAFLQKMYV